MKIFVFSVCILYRENISGGDVVLPHIAKRWGDRFDLHVITTAEGEAVWRGLGAAATFHLLPRTIFDRSDSILLGPIKYLIRTFQALRLSRKLVRNESEKFITYTAPEFIPDVLPAFLLRRRYPQSRWVAWVYHVILPPRGRKGNFLFNLFSFLLQRGGLALLKRRADLIPVLGGTYKDLVDRGFNKDKIRITNAGVNQDLLRSTPPAAEKFDGISIGTLTYTRGVYDLLEIWRLVVAKKPEARLAVIGGASKKMIEDYQARIKDLGLEQNVNYFGFVPKDEDVYAILKSSKLYLCPLHENGWSLPVAEAFTAGVPAVAYDLKMFRYAFKKGFVIVPMYAEQAFAEKVLELLNDESQRQALAQAALEESANFDWANIAAGLGEAIDQL